MALDKRTREQMLAHCGEIHEDDGIDPREYFKAGRIHKKEDRKAKQLCRQVAETLDQVLSGEIDDDLLRGLRVSGVMQSTEALGNVDRQGEAGALELIAKHLQNNAQGVRQAATETLSKVAQQGDARALERIANRLEDMCSRFQACCSGGLG